jgi:Protein of unknown function (DUF2490)
VKGRRVRRAIAIVSVVGMCSASGFTQTTQTLPEVDTYVKVNSGLRITVQAKETREGGSPSQAEVGPSVDFYLKPILKLRNASKFDLDDSKSRPMVVSFGYRYLPQANGGAAINRIEPVITFSFPMKGAFLLSDKNRADLDWQNGGFEWHCRNRFQVERALTIRSYHPAPYASTEFFYESNYHKWSDTAIYAGCLFPVGRRLEFNPYYEHQNNTGKSPNQQLNQFGIILNMYFLAK